MVVLAVRISKCVSKVLTPTITGQYYVLLKCDAYEVVMEKLVFQFLLSIIFSSTCSVAKK